jgi:hypothetical protein
MPDKIDGLPVHPLIIHATVVAVPLAALLIVLVAVWPRTRSWGVWLALVVAAGAAILYPLTKESGENLAGDLGGVTPAIQKHEDYADQLGPWVYGVLAVAVVLAGLYLLQRRSGAHRDSPGAAVPTSSYGRTADRTWVTSWWMTAIVAVVAIVVAVGTLVTVFEVGHSGAEAVWSQGG